MFYYVVNLLVDRTREKSLLIRTLSDFGRKAYRKKMFKMYKNIFIIKSRQILHIFGPKFFLREPPNFGI